MINLIKFKKSLIPFSFVLFTLSLIVFSFSNLTAAKNGLILWTTSIVPSLFPFLVATDLLSNTQIPYLLGNLFSFIIKPIFNVRGEASFAIIMGFLSGYPIGAKIVCNFRKQNILSKEECERLLSFTNNSGPLFILGTVGISFFRNFTIGLLLLIAHILGSLTVGFIFRFWKYKTKENTMVNTNYNAIDDISLATLGQIISDSISHSISTIMSIGGFVVLFSVVISIFNTSKLLNILAFTISPCFKLLKLPTLFISPFITGLLEITNGIYLISAINIKTLSINLVFTSFLLGFGGISIFLQILSIISETDLSIKPYIYGKILHGIISAFYTLLFINIFPFFN